jgi:hypothetical protein
MSLRAEILVIGSSYEICRFENSVRAAPGFMRNFLGLEYCCQAARVASSASRVFSRGPESNARLRRNLVARAHAGEGQEPTP